LAGGAVARGAVADGWMVGWCGVLGLLSPESPLTRQHINLF